MPGTADHFDPFEKTLKACLEMLSKGRKVTGTCNEP